MEMTLKSVTYGIIVDGKKYYVCHCLVWKKEYPNIALWCTTINGAMKLNQAGYAQSWRKTMPTKAEIRRHVKNTWYPDLPYYNANAGWSEKTQVWHNPCVSKETLMKYEKRI